MIEMISTSAQHVVSSYKLTQEGNTSHTWKAYQLAIGAAEQLKDLLIKHLSDLETVARKMRETGELYDLATNERPAVPTQKVILGEKPIKVPENVHYFGRTSQQW